MRSSALSRCRSLLSRFRREEGGQIALIFALGLPVLATIAAGGIDLSRVVSERSRMQDMADAAALAGAAEMALAVGDEVATERVDAMIAAYLAEWPKGPAIVPTIQVVEDGAQRIMHVRLDAVSQSFFVNLLPPGGWKFSATSRAVSVGLTPLCVLATATAKDKIINIKDTGRLQAPACLVHSNRDILVEGGRIEAAMVQAVTSAGGQISPAAGTGAAEIEDPFTTLPLPENKPCSGSTKKTDVITGTIRLPAGVHCGGFTMAGDSVLILERGEHWFQGGHLVIKENARLDGSDVALFFDKESKFEFKDHALVDLDGRKQGLYAGMVMAATRGNTQDFIITSDNVNRLLGVIYVPEAQLIVEGHADVARDSAWTVIVARVLQLKGSPSLVINANYASSDVPVPQGVGPRSGGARLIY